MANVVSQLIAQPKNRKTVLFIQARDDNDNDNADTLKALKFLQALLSGPELLAMVGAKQLNKFVGELKQSLAAEKLMAGMVGQQPAAGTGGAGVNGSISGNKPTAAMLMQQQTQLSDSHYAFLLTQLIQQNLRLVLCFQMQSFQHRLRLRAIFPQFFSQLSTVFLF